VFLPPGQVVQDRRESLPLGRIERERLAKVAKSRVTAPSRPHALSMAHEFETASAVKVNTRRLENDHWEDWALIWRLAVEGVRKARIAARLGI
jgi:hypothetical protein